MPARKKKSSQAKTRSRKKTVFPRASAGKKSKPKQKTDIPQTLKNALTLYRRDQFNDAVTLLNSLPEDKVLKDNSIALEYYRILAFSLTNLGEFNKAHDITQKALQIDADDRDFYFVQTFIATSFNDFEKTIECGGKFLEPADNEESGTDKKFLSNGQLHLLYNYLGLAYKSRRDYDRAVECLLKAIEYDSKYNHPYLNLGNLYLQLREYDKAEEIVGRGLKSCSQVQELQLLKKTLDNRATISACMIVKNEEEMLPRCLESIRSWVDEIIIVDTGSTDRTVEIAESYGAKIYHQEWTKDFSYHRNYSISKATGDWIFIIDADEEFVTDDLPLVRQAVAQTDYRLVSVNVYNVNQETGQVTSFLHSVRLFRRDADLRYDGIVHNQLQFNVGEKALRPGISIRHYGYDLSPEKMKKKLARSRELIETQLKEDPNNCFVHYNYVQLLRSGGKNPDPETCQLMIKHASRAVELSREDEKYGEAVGLMALHQLATTYISMKEYDKAIEACQQALEIKPDFLDPILSLAHAYSGMKRLDLAEEYYHKFLEMRDNYDETTETINLIQVYVGARHNACYGLALINEFRGDMERAKEYYLKSLEDLEHFRDTFLRLARIYLDLKEPGKAIEYIDRHLEWQPDSDLANVYKAEYYAVKNDRDKVEKYLEQALNLAEDNFEVFDRAARFRMNMGEYDKAVPLAEKIREIKPEFNENYKRLGVAYYNIGDFECARQNFKIYIKLQPDDFEAINDLANCGFKLGDYKNAEQYYMRALEGGDDLSLIYRNLGLTRFHLGKLDEALTLLEKYSESAPEDIEIFMAIGVAYSKLGDYSKAISYLEKYLFFNPNDIKGLFNISECYFHLGYTDSAAIGYSQILKTNPHYQPAKGRLKEIQASKIPV